MSQSKSQVYLMYEAAKHENESSGEASLFTLLATKKKTFLLLKQTQA